MEQGEDEDDVVQQARDSPMPQRLAHKHWKVRAEAYREIAQAGEYADSVKQSPLSHFAPLASKAAADPNVNALDAALDALAVTLRAADETFASKHAPLLADALVTKGLTGKHYTIPKATEALLLLVELDCAQPVVDTILKGCSARSPKAAATAIDALRNVIMAFGTAPLDTKGIMKALPPLFDNKDKSVREKAKGVTVELARWLGTPTVEKALLQKVRDNQKRELEEMLSDVERGQRQPTRLLRKHAHMAHEVDSTNQSADGHQSSAAESEQSALSAADDLVEPTDVLPKLNHARGENYSFWDAIESQKWKERHEALSYLRSLVAAPKLADGDYHKLSTTLKKVIQKDANVVCVSEACNALAGLVNGLGSRFKDSRMIAPHLFPKLKEKKDSVCNAVLEALRALTNHCIGLHELSEEITEALSHKTPKVQILTMTFLSEQVTRHGKQTAAKLHKDILPACLKNLEHSSPEVRDASVQAVLGFCQAANGTGPIAKHINSIDEAKRKKLEDALASQLGMGPKGKQQELQQQHQAGHVEPQKQQQHRQNAREHFVTAENGVPHKSDEKSMKRTGEQTDAATSTSSQNRPLNGGMQRSASSSTTTSASLRGGSASQGSKPKRSKPDVDADDVSVGNASTEEVETKLNEVGGDETTGKLKSSDWKERLAGVQMITEAMQSSCSKETADCIVRGISSSPGWSEKNVQILLHLVRLIGTIAGTSYGFDRRHAKLAIMGMSSKIVDMKLKEEVYNTLTSIAQAVGPHFVHVQLLSHSKNEKNPKILAEALEWTANSLEMFGLGLFDFNKCMAAAREALDSSNPNVKQSAIKVCGELHRQLGQDVKRFVSDVKPALQTSLGAEFARKPFEGIQQPQLDVRGVDCSDVNLDADEMLPRQDLSEKIDSSMVANLSSSKWQDRQAALDSVENVLKQTGSKISGVPNELIKELRGRLQDTHKNLVATALGLFGSLATALGSSAEKRLKPAIPDIVRCLSDGKKQVREAALKCIDATNEAVGTVRCLPVISEHIAGGKLVTTAEGKKDGISWVASKVEAARDGGLDAACLIHLAGSGLVDKTTEVRTAASGLVQRLADTHNLQTLWKDANSPNSPEKAFLSCLQRLTNSQTAELTDAPDSSYEKTRERDAKISAGTCGDRNGATVASSSTRGSRANGSESKGQASANSSVGSSTGNTVKVHSGSAMQASSNKESRLQKLPKKPMAFEDVLPLAVGSSEELQKELGPLCRQDVRDALFSSDFKQHMKAADELEKMLATEPHTVVCNFDLILRWIALRLAESQPNTQSMLRVISLIDATLKAMTDAKYRICDEEVGILAPALIDKAGHNLDKIRQEVRKLIAELYHVFPVSKIVPFLVEGAKHKNTRTRSECMEEIGVLLQRHGIATCSSAHNRGVIQVLMRQAGERDSQSRSAALNALAACYKAEGDKIWQKINPNSSEASLLRDKLKWIHKEIPENGAAEGTAATAAQGVNDQQAESANIQQRPCEGHEQCPRISRRPVQPQQRDAEHECPSEQQQQSKAQSHKLPANTESAYGTPPRSPAPTASSFMNKSPAPRRELSLRQLQDMVMEESLHDPDVDMLKQMYHKLKDVVEAGESVREQHGVDPDELGVLLIDRLEAFFHRDVIHYAGDEFLARPLKYSMNCLATMSEEKDTATLSKDNLKRIYGLLIQFLNHPKLHAVPEGDQIWTSLNRMSGQFLQNGSKKVTACALLEMLREDKMRGESIVKCLVKVTKTLPASLEELADGQVLLEIHKSLECFRASDDSHEPEHKPFRMVKTLLYQLCRHTATDIETRLASIPDIASDQDAWIYKYVRLNLHTLGHSTTSQSNMGLGEQSPDEVARHADIQLRKVLEKIDEPENLPTGVNELLLLHRKRPELDVSRHPRFDDNIKRKVLQHIEDRDDPSAQSLRANLRNAATQWHFDGDEGTSSPRRGVHDRTHSLHGLRQLQDERAPTEAEDGSDFRSNMRPSLNSLRERMRQIEEEKAGKRNTASSSAAALAPGTESANPATSKEVGQNHTPVRPNTSGGERGRRTESLEAERGRRARASVTDLQQRLREIETTWPVPSGTG